MIFYMLQLAQGFLRELCLYLNKGKGDSMWYKIKTKEDIAVFMTTMDYFHDTCIKEMKYVSGAYVQEDGGMHPMNDKRSLKVFFQLQRDDFCAIEIEFEGLKYLKLYPEMIGTCEILDASMIKKEDDIIWCDCGGVTERDIDEYEGTSICASKVKWRKVDEYIGPKEVYVIRKE